MTGIEYVKSIDLRGTPRYAILEMGPETETTSVFEDAKKQSQVVGSSLFSFAPGVGASMREAISDSALFAQLVANKLVPAEDQPLEWFKAYSTALENIGWTLQENGWTDYTREGTEVEVNKQVLAVMTVALGPAPAALAIVTATITALGKMRPGSSWLTIFSRESQKAKIARFQIGLVESNDSGDTFVSLIACLIEADSLITQALFFKWKNANARFRANTAKVSLNVASLKDLGVAIRAKTRVYQHDYVSSVLDLL